ncbi:MAG: TonB-dependent receptor [Gemmatimonadales bacterium]|nr:MAG: TonB-dependent receptor [Gemmatimonadales bacterium]
MRVRTPILLALFTALTCATAPASAGALVAGGQQAATAGTNAQTDAVLAIRVVEAGSEQPLSGIRVRLPDRGVDGLTDGDGHLRFTDLEPGPIRLRIEAPGYHPQETRLELTDGVTTQRIALDRWLFELEGVTTTGTPLRGIAPYQPGQAYDREALLRRAATSLGEMLDGEPGLAMRSFGASTGRPVIRGLDGDRVAVLENGQRMGDMSETAPDHAIAMDPLSPSRIEVVRGPASLLYGSSALGGVVNLLRDDIPRTWSQGSSGSVAIQGATANRLEATSLTGTLGGDRWATTGRFALRSGDDFRSPGATSGILPGTWGRMTSGGAGVGYHGNRVTGGIALDLHDHDFGLPEALDDPDERVELRTDRQRARGVVDLEMSGRFETLELRAAAARYRHQEVEIEGPPGGPVEEDVEHDFTRHTVDLTLTATHGPLGPASGGAVGVSLLSQSLAVSGADEFHPDGSSLALALFGFEQITLSDALSLQFGLRAEGSRIRIFANEAFPEASGTRNALTLSASAGLSHRLGDRLEVGAQIARAHRSPLLEELHADGPHLGAARYEVGNPELRNEIGHGADLFAEYTTPRVRAELAGFLNRIQDFVFTEATGDIDPGSGLPVVEWKAAPATFRGGEASVEFFATDRLSLRASGDWVLADRRDADRTPLPFIPPARLMTALRYDSGSVWFGARTRLAAAQNRVALGSPTDGYGLLDLQFGIRPAGGHTVAFRLDNALDTAYRDHLSRVDERRFPMPGRNLSVVYRWEF